jgi:hypothetical protein
MPVAHGIRDLLRRKEIALPSPSSEHGPIPYLTALQ